MVYEYKEENSDGIDLSQAHERNRTETTRSRQSLFKAHQYGNRAPYFPILSANEPPTPQPTEWLFEAVLDYGEHDLNPPTPDDSSSRGRFAVIHSPLTAPVSKCALTVCASAC